MIPMNDMLFEAIKQALICDMKGMYNHFKEDTENLRGVIVQINSSRGLGDYLKSNPDKITELAEYLFKSLNFSIKIILTAEGDDRFYPLIEN